MGGIFSSPSPLPAPKLPELPDPDEEQRKLRLKAMDRQRRGRGGMITTSPRGIFSVTPGTLKRKSLLGE